MRLLVAICCLALLGSGLPETIYNWYVNKAEAMDRLRVEWLHGRAQAAVDRKNMLLVKEILAQKTSMETDLIAKVAQEVTHQSRAHNLPPTLVTAVLITESGGDPYAVSPKGAKGLMQIMPMWNKANQSLFDVSYNIKLGAFVLSYEFRRSGSIIKALTNYNGRGENARSYAECVLSLYHSFDNHYQL